MNTVARISKQYYSLSWHASKPSKPYLSAHKSYYGIPAYSTVGD